MKMTTETKDEKSKRNAALQQCPQGSCDNNLTERSFKNQSTKSSAVALKPRHILGQKKDKQNSCMKYISKQTDYFFGVKYQSLEKISEIKSLEDSKENELKEEETDLSQHTLRKAQVRLDFPEKHESEKLKSYEGLGRLIPDWIFKSIPVLPNDQVVYMMHSEAFSQDIDNYVQDPNVNRDSGYRGSNAASEEPQGRDTEENTRKFYQKYVEISDPKTGDETEEEADLVEEEIDEAHHVEEEEKNKTLDSDIVCPQALQKNPQINIDDLSVPALPQEDACKSQVTNCERDYKDIHSPNSHDAITLVTNEKSSDCTLDINLLTDLQNDGHVDGNRQHSETDSTSKAEHPQDAPELPSSDRISVPLLHTRKSPGSMTEDIQELTGIIQGVQVNPQESLLHMQEAQAGSKHGTQTRPSQAIKTLRLSKEVQARATQGTQVLRSTQGAQTGLHDTPERLHHTGHMVSVILETGHQEQLLQQCIQRVTGGNKDLARQFLSHLLNNTLLSQHCGVIVCRALQTVVGRRGGGRFTSGQGGQYVVLSEEGSGGYGEVHRCEAVIVNGDGLESRVFARKRIPIHKFHAQEASVYIEFGARLPRTLDFLGIVRNENYVDLFFQYAAGGSLAQWIKTCPNLVTINSIYRDVVFNQVHGFIYQLLRCTADFNQLYLFHRDIKAWNLLFTRQDRKTSMVLIDTGTTKVWRDVLRLGISRFEGTIPYCSPECEEVCACPEDFLDLELCDAWEAGATVYHILTRRPLWIEKREEFKRMYGQNWHKVMRNYIASEGWRVCELINDIDQSQHRLVTSLVQVLSCLLEYDVSLRRTASEVLELPIFSENPYSKFVVMFGHTPIYIKYFRSKQGFHLHLLDKNAEFREQLKLHVPNFKNGYSLLSPTKDKVSGQFVLMNVGTIFQDTCVYLKTLPKIQKPQQ